MKTFYTSLLLSLFTLTQVMAQEEHNDHANEKTSIFGIKAGLNLSDLSGDAETTEPRLSFHIGATVELMISEKFSVQPELIYSSQGGRGEYFDYYMGNRIEVEETLKLDYIYIPILAKYYLTEQLSFEAGPQVGFLVSARFDAEANFNGETESVDQNVNDSFKSIDLGLGVGMGYAFDNKLNVAARYNFGLSNIIDDDDAEDSKSQNSVFQISLGYRFD